MNKIKLFIASALFCAMGYAGYTAYERITMSETEKFMLMNIEALATNETENKTGSIASNEAGTYFCCIRDNNPKQCSAADC